VIDCEPDRGSISKALELLYSPEFQSMLPTVKNPYGTGGASKKIVKILEDASFNDLLKKTFFDLH